MQQKPLIVQSDNTLLLEVDNPDFENARDAISPFAELEKSPEHMHTYRITPLSLWNAASSGLIFEEIIKKLKCYSRYPVPQSVLLTIKEQLRRYGLLKLEKVEDTLVLRAADPLIIKEIIHTKGIEQYVDKVIDDYSVKVKHNLRGHVKQALIKIGYPVEDLAGYEDGDLCILELRKFMSGNIPFIIRDYQQNAINAFHRGGGPDGGSGVVVLPCGAGKTIVGIGVISLMQTQSLILVANTVALRQWKEELLGKTSLSVDAIGEFSGEKKEIRPITIATYHILTYRKNKKDDFLHFDLFRSKNWGLIIYDEVHLLPAPIFRMTSEIQSKRRLGLTATLIREDGMESDVFSLIGPKKYDMPWKVLEKANWIAEALCTEIKIDLPESQRYNYSVAPERDKFRIASENPEKLRIVQKIIDYHKDAQILIIGQYISQLNELAKRFRFPIITGKIPVPERETLYSAFRRGELKRLIVSKVANFAVDLPDASVAIQVSGTFGSRQEEAQRLGRILRLKKDDNSAYFYTIVTANSVEETFSLKRQLFLTEQGYSYIILNREMVDEKFKAKSN
ncbi:MAG: DNA repair helicase XPB [Spirochaetota bacterium]|nr:DNA repair helicase XPB [Spirochaetota bacterium]